MEFDISTVPFSRFGSYMTFNLMPPRWGQKGLLLRTVQTAGAAREAFRMALVSGGKEVPYRVIATPTLCTLEARQGRVEICFAETDVARMRGAGVSLRLVSVPERGQYAFPAGEGRWHVNCAPNAVQYLFIPLSGALEVTARHEVRTDDRRRKARPAAGPSVVADFVPGDGGAFECAVHQFVTTPRPCDLSPGFEESLRGAEAEWRAWLKTTPALPEEYAEAAELAMYVNWASVVAPAGNFRRPTMLMSKNWMTQCWSWDHCFNAMALSYRNADLAWDQLMVHFDLQDGFGVLPDGVDSVRMGWNFCKPPVHGWTLSKMIKKRGLLTGRRLKEIYPRLARWTDWWMRHRDCDGDGVPEYHHGNDSGWDNATVFDGGFPVAAPDLPAYLVLQMDVLADLARRLGRARAASTWKRRADALLGRMIGRLWDGEQFVSRRAFTGEVFPEGDSLINFLPVVLGRRLPAAIRRRLADALEPDGRFVTAHGPATESPGSPLYVPDGYWRGPIWGPEAVIIADGLRRAGFREQAVEIARRYCDMCVRSGFAENYDALTGEPLRDKAYTWGSSAFLILAHELLRG